MIFISVIVPLYNKESIIEHTLKSVLTQDYVDFEVIVVNDGSTDKSIDIVKSLNDPRIRLIEQENGGPSKARNKGITNANGEWIVFLDADDEFLPGALKHFIQTIDMHNDVDFIACPFYTKSEKNKKLQFTCVEKYVKKPFMECFFGEFLPRTGSFICKKELLLRNTFNADIRRYEDLDLLYRLYHSAKIYVISTPSMIVNQIYASASHGRKDILEDFVGHLDFNGKSFWEKMCLYQLFIWERNNYPDQCRRLYPSLYKRLDLYLLYQFFTRTKKIWR